MILFVTLLISQAVGDDPAKADATPPEFSVLLEKSEKQKPKRLKELRDHVQWLLRQQAEPRNRKRRRELGKQIKQARDEGKRLLEGGHFVTEMDIPITVGDVGTKPGDGARVEQVINANEMIVSIEYSWVEASAVGNRPVYTMRSSSQAVWLKGCATKDAVTGKPFTLPKALVVTGTKQYDNLAGSTTTVPIVEPYDVKPFEVWAKNLPAPKQR
jgi:hypothetical protein